MQIRFVPALVVFALATGGIVAGQAAPPAQGGAAADAVRRTRSCRPRSIPIAPSPSASAFRKRRR